MLLSLNDHLAKINKDKQLKVDLVIISESLLTLLKPLTHSTRPNSPILCDDIQSDTVPDTFGVTQGPVLVAIFAYIANLPKVIQHSQGHIFVDDCILHKDISTDD